MVMDPTTQHAMDRWVAFWRRHMPGRILATVGARPRTPQPSRWESYVKAHGLETEKRGDRRPLFEDLERLFDMYEARLPARPPDRVVQGDVVGIPIFCPTVHFGEGIHGAFFGGKVTFSSSDIKTDSVAEPVITDWAQLTSLEFDEQNVWVQRILEMLRFFSARSRRRFCLSPYCTIDGLNFAVVMRGATRAFMDVVDHEDWLRRLFDLGFDTSVRFWDLQRAVVEASNKEVIQHDAYAALCSAHAKPGLSVDAYSLCAPEVYARLGLEYTQKLIDTYAGGYLHVHALGHHLLPRVGELRGLTDLMLADDPGCDRAFPKLKQIRAQTGDTPLRVSCTLQEFTTGLRSGSLPGGVAYLLRDPCASVDEANRLMDKVRAYRVSG